MKGRFPKTLIESEYNRMPTNVDLRNIHLRKSTAFIYRRRNIREKGSGDYGNL